MDKDKIIGYIMSLCPYKAGSIAEGFGEMLRGMKDDYLFVLYLMLKELKGE